MKNVLILLTILVAAGCQANHTLPPLETVDRIVVEHSDTKEVLAIIRDPDSSDALVAFVNSHPDGWSVPWAGPPVGQVDLWFYADDKFVGSFYVGPDFFGRNVQNFYSKRVTKNEIEQLSKLVDVDLLAVMDEAD